MESNHNPPLPWTFSTSPPLSSESTSPSSPSSSRDPSHRRASFHLPPSHPSDAQSRRRDQALVAQQARRQHAFMSARDTAGFGLDDMEDLVLDDVHADWEDEDEVVETKAVGGVQGKSGLKKRASGKARRLYKSWAKNVLMWAETLDLGRGLPPELTTAWSAVVIPKGKRCLCATSNNAPTTENTVLLSRVSGRTLERRQSAIPADCMLDGVWDEELSVFWVIDLIRWKGTWFLECESEMRFFFLNSRLSELPPQLHNPFPSTVSRPPILLLPVPTLSPPLTPTSLLSLSSSLLLPSLFPALVLLPTPSPSLPLPQTVEIPFLPTGVVLYLSKAHYESGLTALAGWIPVKVEDEEEKKVAGLERFVQLLRE